MTKTLYACLMAAELCLNTLSAVADERDATAAEGGTTPLDTVEKLDTAEKIEKQLRNTPDRSDVAGLQKILLGIERLSIVDGPDSTRPTVKPIMKFRLLVRFRGLMDQEIDPKFDPEDVPQINVAPPSLKYESGIAPDAIEEDDIRAAYVTALAKNEAKRQMHHRQTGLRKLAHVAERDLAGLQNLRLDPVKDRQEIEQVLNRELADQTLRKRLHELIFPPRSPQQ